MAKFFDQLDEKHIEFIHHQKIFFVATAAESGSVNLSPKDGGSVKVINENQINWLNLTGSGNETAAHLNQINRITLMWCSFDKQPLILRIYGTAKIHHAAAANWTELVAPFPIQLGARQVFEIQVDKVQTSCGFGVPYYEFLGERDTLKNHWEKKADQLHDYWQSRNATSIDGLDTGITKTGITKTASEQ